MYHTRIDGNYIPNGWLDHSLNRLAILWVELKVDVVVLNIRVKKVVCNVLEKRHEGRGVLNMKGIYEEVDVLRGTI